MDSAMNQYEQKYARPAFYWGTRPSPFCLKLLEIAPPDKPMTLLDIGCGEGRNAVFFARNGYQVTAFDLAESGVAKTRQLADQANVRIEVFQGDMAKYRLTSPFDIIFCHGCLQYLPPETRPAILGNYKDFTLVGGLNVLSVFVKKPFIAPAPDGEKSAHKWTSGELFSHYHNWRLEFCTERIFDCNSSGIPHQHAMDQVIARKVE
jgi:tellurite methyltransferase